MSILEKKIIQIGFKDITNYEQLVNLSFPTLFTFESSEQSYIGFTNQYKPKKGILEFILSPSNKQKIKDYLNNNTTVDQLFNNKKIIQYKFNKAELTVKKINVENLKNISPSKELTYNNPFNMIYKEK
jgi:hypothetical protein